MPFIFSDVRKSKFHMSRTIFVNAVRNCVAKIT
jgi:hypothetical protein